MAVPPPQSPALPARPIKGRGAAENPAGRFERLVYEAEPDGTEEESEAPGPRTVYLRDPSRTLLARNDSPDVGFDVSLNPYRGCEHGCSYCLSPDTRILHADMRWRPIGETRPGDRLVGFDERPPSAGRPRKMRLARVLGVWWSRKPTIRLVTRHSDVVTTADHRWLQAQDFRWSRTDRLRAGQPLRHLPIGESSPPLGEDYRAGYLTGLTLGDGVFRYQRGWRSEKGFPAAYWRVALEDREPLERCVEFLAGFGIQVPLRPCDPGPRSQTRMQKVETRSLRTLALLADILGTERPSEGYRRGFLAGFFDAEGHSGTSLRLSQVDVRVLERFARYAASLGFDFVLEPRMPNASTLRLIGSLAERMRFFGSVRPAITSKITSVFGRTPPTGPEPIEALEPGPRRDVVDIQTTTGTFYAEGLATHNCYARPSHEYLGFSSGLDFETRILVKQDAPDLLRRELSAPRWRPRVVGMSGVTDPYQPVERRLRLTRRCLRVFADFRNPVQLITKNALVARDADLLAELAGWNGASVAVSITTLDPDLHRRMEPRASHPEQRLRAIEALAAAGVPVGVMAAPVIPGLTDHELPAILAGARAAGACFAGHIVLRLPRNVKALFSAWLERHHPDRKEKVLNRLRSLRGGRLDDPRFGTRMRGSGVYADQIHDLFELAYRRAGFDPDADRPALSTDAFRRPEDAQLRLF